MITPSDYEHSICEFYSITRIEYNVRADCLTLYSYSSYTNLWIKAFKKLGLKLVMGIEH